MSLKNIHRKIWPFVGLSVLAGYLTVNSCIDDSRHFSKASKSGKEAAYLKDSSDTPDRTMKSHSDSNNLHLDDIDEYDRGAFERMAVNDEYLAKKTEEILIYTSRLDDFLIRWANPILDSVEHAPRIKGVYMPESTRVDDHLSLGQKIRIYFMLDALKDASFRNNIGNIITMDVNDKYAEHGGIVDFNKKNLLQLSAIKSSLGRSIDNDGVYDLDEESIRMPFLAIYHVHAGVYTETDFAGPSSLDMIGPEVELKNIGQVHEFVITSLEKGKFNIDYYGGDSSYGGLRIVDLGVYTYDMPSKK